MCVYELPIRISEKYGIQSIPRLIIRFTNNLYIRRFYYYLYKFHYF